MSLSSRLSDAVTRIGQEFKSVRSAIALKYTKPTTGIPLADLATEVTNKFNISWSQVSGKPSTFTPSTHTHTQGQVSGLTTELSNKVSGSTSGLILWVGPVGNLPSTKDVNTIYLAW